MSDQSTQLETAARPRTDVGAFSIPQYAALGLMALSVAILGFWFLRWSATPTFEVVASGLTPTEVTEVTDELQSAGIDYRLASGGSAVEVSTGSADDARVAVGDLVSTGGATKGYEILDEQGFLASSFRQRVDYQRAIEGELSRTVMEMEAVTTATVHLAIPEERIFSESQDTTRASVVVGGLIDQSTVAAIANVIASSVPGLDVANVTVANTSGRILSGGNAAGFASDQQLQMQDLYEAQLEFAAESMLAVALGPGSAVVRVTASLNFDELESQVLTYDGEPVTLQEQTIDEAFTGDPSVSIGTLGAAEDVTELGDIAGEEGSAYLRQEQTTESGVATTTVTKRQAPGSVDRLSVAVLLDDSLDPSPDTAAISALVAAAVGIDDVRGDNIVVEAMTFDEVPVEEVSDIVDPAAAAAGGLDVYIGYAKTGAAVIGMILALLFLRKGLKTLIPIREPVDIDPATIAQITRTTAAASSAATAAAPALGTGDVASAGVAAAVSRPAPVAASIRPATEETATTIDMLDLIDSQSDEVGAMLRDMVSGAV